MANSPDRTTWPYGLERHEIAQGTLPPPVRSPAPPDLDDSDVDRSAASTQRIRVRVTDPSAITQPSLPAPVSSRRAPPLDTRYSFVDRRGRRIS